MLRLVLRNSLFGSRVSYNGITSAFQADDRGSTPLTRSGHLITRLKFVKK